MSISFYPGVGLYPNSSVKKAQREVTPQRFGSSYEPQHPPLTYKYVKTVSDKIVGPIQVYRFSNGMMFYGIQQKKVPLVSIGEMFKTGAINELPDEHGVSHFLEHLFFKGTDRLKPGEFERKTSELGGHINACTGNGLTFYYTYYLPKESLAEALKLRAEFIQRPAVPQKELDKERGVVLSEIDMCDSDPMVEMERELIERVWGDSPLRGHGYGRVLGPKSVIQNISRDRVLDYFRRQYDPKHRIILAMGDFDLKPTLDLIAKEYNLPFTPSPIVEKPPTMVPKIHQDKHVTLRRHVKTGTSQMAWDGPKGTKGTQDDRLALGIALHALGEGKTSRLHRRLVEQEQLAHSVSAGLHEELIRTKSQVIASADPDKMEVVKTVIAKEIAKLVKDGITSAELQKAVKQMRGGLIKATERQQTMFGRPYYAFPTLISEGDQDEGFSGMIDRAKKMTPEFIRQTAAKYLAPDAAYSVTMLPKPKKLKEMGQAASKASGNVRFGGTLRKNESTQTLQNGSRLLVHHQPKTLRANVSAVFKRSSTWQASPAQLPLLAMMIKRGTADLPADKLDALLEENDINFSASGGADGMTLGLESDREDTQKMFGVLQTVLQQGPAFQEKDLAHVKRLLKNELTQTLDQELSTHSFDLVDTALYPNGHPYGTSTQAVLEDVDKVTMDQLKALYQKVFQPKYLTLGIGGENTLTQLTPQAEDWLSNLKNQDSSLSAEKFAVPAALKTSKIITKAVKSMDEMKLSEIVQGWYGPDLHDKDASTLRVLGAILNNMTGPLYQTFREGKDGGLCYSVYFKRDTLEQGGMLKIYIGTPHDKVSQVLPLLKAEVQKLIDEPVGAKELAKAKLLLKSSVLTADETLGEQTGVMVTHQVHGTDSPQEMLAKADKVTPEDIQTLAKKYLSKPSVTAITAPKEALKRNGLPVDGERVLG
ncbi:MAG: insulinase family protein [Vampirovibrio sp.]|nr:insulinase family protein [Vampirovibrio sp.]